MRDNTVMVSVCSVTFNQASFIKECLDGILMQKTNFKYEIIINDDCSTDGTTEILLDYQRKYPEIVKPIIQTENQYSKGIPILASIVFPQAIGKYIAICEGDDYWTDPLKLQKQFDFLEANPDYGMVYGKVKVWDERKGQFNHRLFGCNTTSYRELMLKGNGIPTLSTFFRKSLICSYLKDITIQRNWGPIDDLPMWLYMAHQSKIKMLDDVLGVYRKLIRSASGRESYNSILIFAEYGENVKKYFSEKFNDGLNDELQIRYCNKMFLKAFHSYEWIDAISWFEKGEKMTFKNKLRYFLIKCHVFRFMAVYLMRHELI